MDIGLPDTDGLKLADKIRNADNMNKTVPIIALTAHDENELQNRATWIGVDSYIVKPLTPESCEKIIKKCVDV